MSKGPTSQIGTLPNGTPDRPKSNRKSRNPTSPSRPRPRRKSSRISLSPQHLHALACLGETIALAGTIGEVLVALIGGVGTPAASPRTAVKRRY